MVGCSQAVYPPAVIQSVIKQMDVYETNGSPIGIPATMKLQPCMVSANLKDAMVRKCAALVFYVVRDIVQVREDSSLTCEVQVLLMSYLLSNVFIIVSF